MMDKELTREMELKAMEMVTADGMVCCRDCVTKALSETYTRAQSDLAKKILGVVPEKQVDSDYGSGWNEASEAILSVLKDSGVEIEKETV